MINALVLVGSVISIAAIDAVFFHISVSYSRLFLNAELKRVVIVLAIVSGLGLLVSGFILSDTLDTHRAFVSVDGLRQEANRSDPSKIDFSPLVRNSGPTPALDVEIVAVAPSTDEMITRAGNPILALTDQLNTMAGLDPAQQSWTFFLWKHSL
ncbi:MAG TPA: hypothetical protein VME69_14000 [Methylocella sp.]|nr:hypothetical protein [Methylocella sp.]